MTQLHPHTPPQLEDLLADEQAAAMAADVEALVALQADKRVALAQLRAGTLPEARWARLQEQMRFNVGLIRQLVQGFGGLVGDVEREPYNAYGRRETTPPGRSRGAL